MDRREFLKRGATLGISAPLTAPALGQSLSRDLDTVTQRQGVDIAAVAGSDYYANAVRAVELLGGMGSFVPRGATVGLLVNSPWQNPGTYTNPDVSLAVLRMCLDAGAGDIHTVEGASADYWHRSTLAGRFASEIAALKPSGDKNVIVEIPNGVFLKEATVSHAFMECDVLIDIPVAKDHDGTRYTGTLKNVMGACIHDPTCRFMHFGSGAAEFYGDPSFLSQCIADLCLVRQPDLCVVDATEFVTTNGPAGPGDIQRPQKVVVGTDMVAVDAYCAEVRGLRCAEVDMIRMARDHGIGSMDIATMRVEEETLGA
jgi:uncharacterized protein (DUF362 family)